MEEDGGGGFWICEAVGARLCRIEYVRCMMMSCVSDQRCYVWWQFLLSEIKEVNKDNSCEVEVVLIVYVNRVMRANYR